MNPSFLLWILQQDVDGSIYDYEESNEIEKQLGL